MSHLASGLSESLLSTHPELIGVVVGALLGATLGLGAKWIEQLWSRRRRRKSLATALLEDLRTVELNVRYLADHAEPARRPGGDLSQLFKRVVESDDLLLFKSDLISILIGFVGILTDIDEAILEFRQSDQKSHWLHGTVKTKAFFAAGRIASLKASLERAGGSSPRYEALDSFGPNELPPLSPPAFAEWYPDVTQADQKR